MASVALFGVMLIPWLAPFCACADSQIDAPQPAGDPTALRKRLPTLLVPEGRLPPAATEPDLNTADQLFGGDEPVMPPTAAERQIPTPPPPATTTTPTPSRPPSAADVLQALLPVLALAGAMGGHSWDDGPFAMFGSGSWEHGPGGFLPGLFPGLLGPSLLGQALGGPGGIPRLRAPPIPGGSLTKTYDPAYNNEGAVQFQCNDVPSPICLDAPFDKILSIGDLIVAIKGNRVYNIQPDGTPYDPEPSGLDPALDGMTATANMGGAEYIFQGDQYYKYNAGIKDGTSMLTRPVAMGFPGLPGPVDGAFRLNNDTYVFVSGSRFYYYQPGMNPPVDPLYSPQPLSSIPGAPPTVDSVFHLKGRPVLYRHGTLYELEPGKMKVRRKIPLKTADGRGWLKCVDDMIGECDPATGINSGPPLSRRKVRQRTGMP